MQESDLSLGYMLQVKKKKKSNLCVLLSQSRGKKTLVSILCAFQFLEPDSNFFTNLTALSVMLCVFKHKNTFKYYIYIFKYYTAYLLLKPAALLPLPPLDGTLPFYSRFRKNINIQMVICSIIKPAFKKWCMEEVWVLRHRWQSNSQRRGC